MDRTRVLTGRSLQGARPEWSPLVGLVGERLTGDFMWMFEVVLSDGTTVQAYKHIDTRRYVHLAGDGTTFVYEPPDRYRRVPTADALAAVFGGLAGLAGVTAEQVGNPWAAVERLERVSRRP